MVHQIVVVNIVKFHIREHLERVLVFKIGSCYKCSTLTYESTCLR